MSTGRSPTPGTSRPKAKTRTRTRGSSSSSPSPCRRHPIPGREWNWGGRLEGSSGENGDRRVTSFSLPTSGLVVFQFNLERGATFLCSRETRRSPHDVLVLGHAEHLVQGELAPAVVADLPAVDPRRLDEARVDHAEIRALCMHSAGREAEIHAAVRGADPPLVERTVSIER